MHSVKRTCFRALSCVFFFVCSVCSGIVSHILRVLWLVNLVIVLHVHVHYGSYTYCKTKSVFDSPVFVPESNKACLAGQPLPAQLYSLAHHKHWLNVVKDVSYGELLSTRTLCDVYHEVAAPSLCTILDLHFNFLFFNLTALVTSF